MVEVKCGRGPTTWMERGERQQRPVSCPWLRPVTNVSCPFSLLLLKSRDVPVNLLHLCSLCQRTSLFLPGWASWILCEPPIGENHGCHWIFRRICLARGYDSFENPAWLLLHFLCLLVHPAIIHGSQETLGNCLTHAGPSELALIDGVSTLCVEVSSTVWKGSYDQVKIWNYAVHL